MKVLLQAMLLLAANLPLAAQTSAQRPAFESFEVATVKPVETSTQQGRMFRMGGRIAGQPSTSP